jgi:diguanylate cyclase (GGDEF)-like protein/PAS domain S-box-containing protein
MFLIWFLIAGLIVGFLRRGRVWRLDRLQLRGAWLVLLSLLIQVLIFPLGEKDPIIKVGTNYLQVISYVPLVIFVYLNRHFRELALIGVGILLNLVPILANGGYMPVSPFALEQAGRGDLLQFLREVRVSGNVILMGPETRLNFLGDVLFLPPWLPFATAFSIGDLLLGLGLFLFLTAKPKGSNSEDKRESFYLALLEKLAQAETVPQIAELALQHAISILPEAKTGSFLLWDEQQKVFKYVACVGWDLDELKHVWFKPEDLLQNFLDDCHNPCIIRDPWRLFEKHRPQMLERFGGPHLLPKAFISVPIRYEGKVIGYFNLDGEHRGAFAERDLRVIHDFQKAIEFALALRLSQEKLQESEQRLRLLFENAPDAIYITDYQSNILDCNRAATEQTGYTKDELLQMNIARDLAVDPPAMDAINERLNRGERVVFEERKRRKDGTVVYTEVAITPITFQGRRAVLSFNRDITWRKRQEEKIYQLWRLSKDLLSSRKKEELAKKTVAFCKDILEPTFCGVYFTENKGYRLMASYHAPTAEVSLPEAISSVAEIAAGETPKTFLLVTPITFDKRRQGYLVIAIQEKVTEYHRRLAELIAVEIANVIQVTEHTERLVEFANRLEKLHIAITKLHQISDEKEMCRAALELLENILGFDYGSIDLVEGNLLVPVCYSSTFPDVVPRPFRIDEGLSGLTHREQRTFWGNDVREVPEAQPVNPEIRSYISVPIGEYGIIQIVSKKEGAFSAEDVKLVEILAQQMYEGLKRIRLEREIREQAIRDPLTGLYNRRYFDIFIELYRKKPEAQILSLSILDMDGFKAVNDQYGHTVGDEVLVAVAELLRNNVRSDDVVIRWGGDEFLILMPKTAVEEAQVVLGRLQRVVASWTHPRHPEIKVGFTAGVAAWDPAEGTEIDEALRAADEDLYAKRGRRRGNDALQREGERGE